MNTYPERTMETNYPTPSNDPDIALAQEWLIQLDNWIATHGTVGPDPFDIKAHPKIRALQDKPILRRASTVLCDLAPHLSRQILHIAPTENPKTHALLALGRLRLFQLTHHKEWKEAAETHLQWLSDHAVPGYSGLCWGYPFPVKAQGLDTPPNSPMGVVGAIAGEAFLLAHEVTGAAKYRDAAISIATHFLEDVPRFDASPRSCCFCYGPEDKRRVHNANLLVAQHLIEVAVLTDDDDMARIALRAVQFTLDGRGADGAFPYGHYQPEDPWEEKLLTMVDHHHTGFVLRSLAAINRHAESPAITNVLRKGFAYYKTQLLTDDGMPRNAFATYPVNIHACAEAILCPVSLNDQVLGAKRSATTALRWSWWYMRDPKTGAPYFRYYNGLRSKIVHPRWGVAWMYRALAEYLWVNDA